MRSFCVTSSHTHIPLSALCSLVTKDKLPVLLIKIPAPLVNKTIRRRFNVSKRSIKMFVEENVLQRAVVWWHIITKSTYNMIRRIWYKSVAANSPQQIFKWKVNSSPRPKVTKPPLCTALVTVFNQCSVITTLSRYLGKQWSAKSIQANYTLDIWGC